MNVTVVAGQNAICFESVVLGVGEALSQNRNLIGLIVVYAYSRFEEIAATAQSLIPQKKTLKKEAFKELYVHLSVPFASWLMSQREPESTRQLQLCEDRLQNFVSSKRVLAPIRDSASQLLLYFKHLPRTSASSFAVNVRNILHQLFVARKGIAFMYTDALLRREVVGAFRLLPQHLKNIILLGRKELINPEIREIMNDCPTAEMISYSLRLGGVFLKATGEHGKEESAFQLEESEFVSLRQEARQVVLTTSSAKQQNLLEAYFSLIQELHMLRFFMQSAKAEILSADERLDSARSLDNIVEHSHSFLNELSPELQMQVSAHAQKSRRKLPFLDFAQLKQTMEGTELDSRPYVHFVEHLAERELGYAFLYGMQGELVANLNAAERVQYEQLLGSNAQTPLATPEEYSKLTGACRPSFEQLKADWEEMVKAYELTEQGVAQAKVAAPPVRFQRTKLTAKESFAPSLKQRQVAAPKVKKKAFDPFAKYETDPKNEKVAEISATAATATAAAGGSAGAPALAAPESVAAPQLSLETIFAKRTVNLSVIKFAPRVQERLEAPKTLGETREDVWAHGFTTQLDEFLGTSYCYSVEKSHPKTGQKEMHHCFIVAVEDEEAPNDASTGRPASVPYVATYTVDKEGVCYHRSLQKKSLFDLFNARAKDQMHDLVQWPSLEQAAAENDKLRVGESKNRPMQLNAVSGIVTVFDKKHNVTFKVLPRH